MITGEYENDARCNVYAHIILLAPKRISINGAGLTKYEGLVRVCARSKLTHRRSGVTRLIFMSVETISCGLNSPDHHSINRET